MKRIFIDGLSGMAQGLFATLIIGTIIQQIGMFVGGNYGDLIYLIGKVAAAFTGAGIGVGVARKLEAQQLVTVCAAVAGMIGAFAGKILAGQVLVDGNIVLKKTFKHRTLEERAEEFGGKLGPYQEYDWGEPVGRERW